MVQGLLCVESPEYDSVDHFENEVFGFVVHLGSQVGKSLTRINHLICGFHEFRESKVNDPKSFELSVVLIGNHRYGIKFQVSMNYATCASKQEYSLLLPLW